MNSKLRVLSVAALASAVLATTGGIAAFAEEGTTPAGDLDHAKSDVKVKLQVPNINEKETLAFDEVPASFDFGLHEIKSGQTNVQSSITLSDSAISVYKDYERDDKWEVRTSVSDLHDDKNSYQVSSFKLNDQEISKTGSSTVIFKSAENNGVGTYSYDINSAAIDFKLPTNMGDGIKNLNGNVYYTLTVTAPAE